MSRAAASCPRAGAREDAWPASGAGGTSPSNKNDRGNSLMVTSTAGLLDSPESATSRHLPRAAWPRDPKPALILASASRPVRALASVGRLASESSAPACARAAGLTGSGARRSIGPSARARPGRARAMNARRSRRTHLMRTTTKLRQLLGSGRTIVAPGCYNALTAKILDAVGFPALYMTGYGTSFSLLGMPDAGLATMTEMHLNARYVANAVKVPVIADADNGYGNAINVIRTVREYVQTGVAAIHLEDQVIPKRCGHVAGRRVVPIDEAVGKIRAADRARREVDPDFVLIARTDARGAHGGSLDEAIRRANA